VTIFLVLAALCIGAGVGVIVGSSLAGGRRSDADSQRAVSFSELLDVHADPRVAADRAAWVRPRAHIDRSAEFDAILRAVYGDDRRAK
jgi:hypothetical protein